MPAPNQPLQGLQALQIKHIPIKDKEVVRYRVYSDAHNFVAVIAENALMAIEAAGIPEPYKLVRDLIFDRPLGETDLELEKAALHEIIPHAPIEKSKSFDMNAMPRNNPQDFVALSLDALSKKEKETPKPNLAPETRPNLASEPISAPVMNAGMMGPSLSNEIEAQAQQVVLSPPEPSPVTPSLSSEDAPLSSEEVENLLSPTQA